MADQSPALTDLSDEQLQALHSITPPLHELSDQELGAHAASMGLVQPEQFQTALADRNKQIVGSVVDSTFKQDPVMGFVVKHLLTTGGRVGDVAAQTVLPLAGGAVGTVLEPGGGTVAGGAAGGLAGDTLAQARQMVRGERTKIGKTELATSAAAGAIPMGGRMLATPAKVVATRALQGAGISTALEAVRELGDEGKLNWQGLTTSGVLGGLFGAGAGGVEAVATRRAVLKAIRTTPEFKDFGGSDSELVSAVWDKLGEKKAAAAAPKNVTPTETGPIATDKPVPVPLNKDFPEIVSQIDQPPAAAAEGQKAPVAGGIEAAKPLAELSNEELLAVAKANPPPEQSATTAPTAQPEVAGNGGVTVAPTVAGDVQPTLFQPDVTAKGKGSKLAFGARPDGSSDILDAIQQLGGVPKPPAGAKGGEWDGHKETFQGSARILVKPGDAKTHVGIDQFLVDLASAHPEFAHLEKDPDAFYGAVQKALAERGRLKTATNLEQQTGKFMEAALEGKGRPFNEKVGQPVSVDELAIGSKFNVKREPFEVVAISPDDGSVTVKDGPRFGTQILPTGELLHPDKGTYQPAEGSTEFLPGEASAPAGNELFGGDTPFNLAGEEQKEPGALIAKTDATGELFNPDEIRSTAPTALDKANAAAREGQPPRTAAMGAAAPRPTAGQQRVQTAQLQARAVQQQQSGLLPAASTLKQVKPTANAAKWFRGARAIVAPQTLDEGAKQMSLILRAAFGAEYAAAQRADAALAQYRKEFDRTPVPRTWKYDPARVVPLPHNYAVMAAIDSGQLGGLTPAEQAFAQTMRGLLDQAIDAVHTVSPHSLRALLENYFPRMWQEPEKNASQINSLLSKRPLEGTKAFLKQRTLDYFKDGLEAGLVPVSDNPVDVVQQKLGEMARFVMGRGAMQSAKQVGLRKFKYVYEPMPEGWKPVDDPSSDVWKPPTVTVQEAYDAQLRAKTIEMLEQLGISHERTTKLGGKRWGEAVENQGIKTKFGGPDFVFWHEAGHMLDWRFPELRELTGAMDRRAGGNEMRALADLRFEGQTVPKSYKGYVRKTEEKIANMFDAYIRAPEKFQKVAPTVWANFNEWLDQHPEVKMPLNEIKPSLRMDTASKEMFVGGPIKLGDWIMPEGAAQVMNNYLQPGLGRYAAFRGLRDVSGLQNGLQLLGFFHGQLVMNDSFYSGIGLALYDAMNGKPVRAAKELLQIPVSPFTSVYRGHKIGKAISDPAAATAQDRQIGQLAIEANLRAGHGPGGPEFTRQWLRAIRELKQSPNTGAAWESFWRTPFAGIELALAPIMNGLVPRMKRGIFARMAERVMSDNPGADLEVIRSKLAEAADATEDRLGQVTYDNLFQNRILKDAMQLALRAYGWQLTKYRMMAGGAADWGRAAKDAASGKKPTVTFRMSYLPAMVIGHAILGATLTYVLTGKRPEKPMDYFFPDTGLKDKLGRPMRVALADFVKDVIADWRSFPNLNKMGSEWTHKLAPMWNVAAEMYQNRDFYGSEIFSSKQLGEPELDHLMQNLKEGSVFLGKNALPFSFQAGKKFTEAGASKAASYVAPFVGFVPAPRYAIETPMQNFLSDQAGRVQYTRTAEQTQKSQQAHDISAALRAHKQLTVDQQKMISSFSKQQLSQIEKRAVVDPDVWAVRALDLDRGMQAWDLANETERAKITPTLRLKIGRALEAGGDRTKLVRYLRLLNRPAK